ncbi:9582_t:CDS:2 [Ambispora leptoticha]|uniref:9582_t:CDS:1 n=1 Tax=Ambispora leptoticha TaxID=144679 RepID=A0A9N9CT39_9GLOM|nr:9582_t:CDS:2 [Ambispora leptoticha]
MFPNTLSLIIIYVDNPPLKSRTASINQEIRKDSRKRLLVQLATCQGTYRPQNLDAMNDRIAEQQQKFSQEEKKKLIEQIRSLEEQGKQLKHQIANTTGGFFANA